MRTLKIIAVTAVMMTVSGMASAGNLTFANGKSEWVSTRCNEPVAPPSLLAVNSETPANDMNDLLQTYNDYAIKMQSYMDCISNEAQGDADRAQDIILKSAQASIESAQNKVSGLHDTLQAHK